MRDFLAKESKEFLPDMEIQIQEMDVKLKISMVIEHKGNWQDSGRRWARRTKVRNEGAPYSCEPEDMTKVTQPHPLTCLPYYLFSLYSDYNSSTLH